MSTTTRNLWMPYTIAIQTLPLPPDYHYPMGARRDQPSQVWTFTAGPQYRVGYEPPAPTPPPPRSVLLPKARPSLRRLMLGLVVLGGLLIWSLAIVGFWWLVGLG